MGRKAKHLREEKKVGTSGQEGRGSSSLRRKGQVSGYRTERIGSGAKHTHLEFRLPFQAAKQPGINNPLKPRAFYLFICKRPTSHAKICDSGHRGSVWGALALSPSLPCPPT